MKSHFRSIVGLFIILPLVAGGMWLIDLYRPQVAEVKGVTYYLKPGTSTKTFLTQFSQQGFTTAGVTLNILAYFDATQLKTGEYLFPKQASLMTIWRQVTHGTGLVYHEFTIIPGWSFVQLKQALAQTEALHHTVKDLDDKTLMTRLGNPNILPEGEFFPETYYYSRGISDLVILKRAFDLMQLKLTEAWREKAGNLPYHTAYQALIAASLIEKEAYLASERPIIASVLVNRLKSDMLLQFDPTIIYGLGSRYDGKIHKHNLLEDTAYNTYLHKGLPPTPIAMPSLDSIEAVLHPKQTDYFYFVAKGDGSHQFSKTLVEHYEAVSGAKTKRESYFNYPLITTYLRQRFTV